MLCYKWVIKDAETILIQVGKPLMFPAVKIPGVARDFSFHLTSSKDSMEHIHLRICNEQSWR